MSKNKYTIIKLNHEVLPYEIEKDLPMSVIDSIYSYLRPRHCQTPARIKLERLTIEINHKIMRRRELIQLKNQQAAARAKHRADIVASLDKIIATLEKML